jgi:hypothetical protein
MKTISARFLLNFTTEQLWAILPGSIKKGGFKLKFDDGEVIETNYKETLYSSYAWDFFRKYGKTPLLKRHHAKAVLKGKSITGKTHNDLLNVIYWDVVDTYHLVRPEDREEPMRMIYEITNNYYVDLISRIGEYTTSVDIIDFVQIVKYPRIKKLLEETEPNEKSIERTYGELENILMNDPYLNRNPLAKAVRAGVVNRNQLLQCVGLRGFATEVDGYRLPTPVMANFTSGMKTLYNVIAESRTAAKSLYNSESPLQDAEYFARRLQLMTMVVEHLEIGDCGSTEYINWHVKGPVIENGFTKYPGDLKFLDGKLYLDPTDPEGKRLLQISPKDTHLIGTMIKMRSVLFCKHHDPHSVCSVCFGGMSDNVMPGANLGSVCSATMTQQTSQSVLSTKHYDGNSASETILLNELAREFFDVSKSKTSYILKPHLKKADTRIYVAQEEAQALTDVKLAMSPDDLSPPRISSISCIAIETTIGERRIIKYIDVQQHGQKAMLTMDFLRYLRVQGWDVSISDTKEVPPQFIFDLKGWDFSKPILKMPDMEFSFSMHSHQVASLIESKMKEVQDRMRPESPVATLQELFDVANSKLNVNIALMEVILYATMIADGHNDCYGLARNQPNRTLGVSKQTLPYRSLGAAFAFEKQNQVILDPRSFYLGDRPDSVFDVFIKPKEVVDYYKHKGQIVSQDQPLFQPLPEPKATDHKKKLIKLNHLEDVIKI